MNHFLLMTDPIISRDIDFSRQSLNHPLSINDFKMWTLAAYHFLAFRRLETYDLDVSE
jgi:hypothetical protein